MKASILLIHFQDKDRLSKVRKAILPLKIRMIEVPMEDYLQPVGCLAGSKDIAAVDEKYEGPGFEDEMLVFADLAGSQLDLVIQAMKRQGVRVPLKAVLTEYNQYWNVLQLHQELKKEDEMMYPIHEEPIKNPGIE